ncbi:uncharacterized protein PHACADRAFT_262294 [Phanerochaete carnosa HHB-10118-sp]|uniref:Uncharacterized protein n=1 Tax=Phanerochaete carnosa (strain HHB-10118-sp) TaxID=650164 RepID=K5VKI1_PHACS|nr:uncharacterized protein PHACADRAFT_262294 [Phanerochaete carnosa HHB-10118-sp]EKM51893.1 hypothetical protein PHACADRAFT_262294 [Phanerochaete carnosa HHB-10118-sp]
MSIPSNCTVREGPAAGLLDSVFVPSLPPMFDWTAMVRARAVFCFFFSLPVRAGISLFFRFDAMADDNLSL